MWSISEMKEKGKIALRGNYVGSVVAAFLLSLLVDGSVLVSSRATSEGGDLGVLNKLSQGELLTLLGLILSASLMVCLISFLLRIFLFNPLQVGCYRFFKSNVDRGPAKLDVIGQGFGGYGRTFLTLLLRDVLLVLWSCLLIVPGIVKSYAYRMVPYILKDNPELSAKEVIAHSKRMMDGHKWQTFLMDLSFLGWFLLGSVTFGLVNIFWTHPYYANTQAALYLEIKDKVRA